MLKESRNLSFRNPSEKQTDRVTQFISRKARATPFSWRSPRLHGPGLSDTACTVPSTIWYRIEDRLCVTSCDAHQLPERSGKSSRWRSLECPSKDPVYHSISVTSQTVSYSPSAAESSAYAWLIYGERCVSSITNLRHECIC